MANGNRLLPVKAVVLSTGVVSMAVIFKLSLPVILEFLTYELPLLWSLVLSWLQPPYLYLLINCIILSIVASSKLQPHVVDDYSLASLSEKFDAGGGGTVVVEEKEDSQVDAPAEEVVFGFVDVKAPITAVEEEREIDGGGGGGCGGGRGGDDEFVVSRSTWTPPNRDIVEYSPVERPPVSARFGHRRVGRASPDGKAPLKVSRPKRQETLESTWRKITEGRSMPLTRHQRKSDTFSGASSPVRVMKKSDTFTGGDNSSPANRSSGGKMRKESSLSQDELNRRVEAFIKKFNEEMRLQRQESLNQYKEMVNQGSN